MNERALFRLDAPQLPVGRVAIEASAGTGKTYSLSGLVVRHVAERGIAASQLLVVTFTRAAAAELRDRTRRALVAARQTFAQGRPPDEFGWMELLLEGSDDEVRSRRERIDQVISSYDDATITTIHGFCQQALRQLGQRSGVPLDVELREDSSELIDEVCRDVLVMVLVDAPDALSWKSAEGKPESVFEAFKQAVTAALGNPGADLIPRPGMVKGSKHVTPELVDSWTSLVEKACNEVKRRRRARQQLGYDDLINGMRDALDPNKGDPGAVVAMLQDRYRLVLVDEFQDTDPVQWDIFRTAFPDRLITVGDPKQAIYRFRGADVHAYLKAAEGVGILQLGTNFRSDEHLVQATNSLLEGFTLGHPDIEVRPVAARTAAPVNRLPSGAPLQIRHFPDHPEMQTTKGLSAPLARRGIVADLVQQVVQLLDDEFVDSTPGGERRTPVKPGDIAVLVPSHAGATEVAAALARAGVPAVRNRTGSVLDTPAANEWLLLLSALERPAHGPTVRAAGLGVFLHSSPAQLDPRSERADEALGELQRRCAYWATQMGERTFLGWYDTVRADSGLLSVVLGRQGGERSLTDLDHIAELLASELLGTGHSPSAALRALQRMYREAEVTGDTGPQMRRIDSDAEAVQISTIHASKGLQYPIVLLPLSWNSSPDRGAWIFQHPTTKRRTVDIAWSFDWASIDDDFHLRARKIYKGDELRNDSLRLLYVALTRAEHRTIVWWAPTPAAQGLALNQVLFGRHDDGTPNNARSTVRSDDGKRFEDKVASVANPPTDADAARRLGQLVARSGGLISTHAVAARPAAVRWTPPPAAEPVEELAIADAGGRVLHDLGWRRWSFTSITNTRDHDWMPVAGGHDEPEVVAADGIGVGDTKALAVPLADLMAGTAFGTLVHTVLERVDPAHPDLDEVLGDEVRRQLYRDSLDVSAGALTAGLLAAIDTPLGELLDDLPMRRIPASDRLAELTFDMPLASPPKHTLRGAGESPVAGGRRGKAALRATARQIGEVLLATLPADDPQREYAQLLTDGRYEVDLAGYLQGSIDAVLRVPDADVGHRFVVVDYKTNRLHPKGAADPLASYHPSLLPAAMRAHDYPLQSVLYSVALHRYLHLRLPGYRPDVHLGGIAYLFVRGMIGPNTPSVHGQRYGVFTWRPPAATVVGLDHLFTTGAVA